MGRSSKRKGSRYERRIVNDHQDEEIVCMRVPHSGAMAGYPGDVIIEDTWQGEVKARKEARGFKKVRDWLAGNDFLFLQEIAKVGQGASPKALVVMGWQKYVEMLQALDSIRRIRQVLNDTPNTRNAIRAIATILGEEP